MQTSDAFASRMDIGTPGMAQQSIAASDPYLTAKNNLSDTQRDAFSRRFMYNIEQQRKLMELQAKLQARGLNNKADALDYASVLPGVANVYTGATGYGL